MNDIQVITNWLLEEYDEVIFTGTVDNELTFDCHYDEDVHDVRVTTEYPMNPITNDRTKHYYARVNDGRGFRDYGMTQA